MRFTMRIGISRIAQETSTFSPILTDINTLRINGIFRGQEVIEEVVKSRNTKNFHGRRSNLLGFLDVISEEHLIGIIIANAQPSGPLTEEAMNTILEWFTEDLKKALPLDGLLFDMHGAFVCIDEPDVEGLFLKKAREIVGNDTVIGVAMDLHANITQRKIENSDIICGYHTHPHVDSRETAQKVAEILVSTLKEGIRPVMSSVKIPMFTPAHTQISDEYPMKELMDVTRMQEEDERVLSSSIFSVQPFLDIPEMGWCSVLVADCDLQLAEQLARELADVAWRQREGYTQPVLTYKEALDEAFSTNIRPIVIADFTDLMTGGGTGDSTWYLKELLWREPQEPCYLTMVDPQAVESMVRAGEGAKITLKLGGKQDNIHSSPVEVTGQIQRVIFPSKESGPILKMMGVTGVLKIGNIYVVIFEHLGEGASPNIYYAAGLDPQKAKILIAKSVVDFREGYRNIANHFLLGEAPGLCPSNLRSLIWKKVPRPIFPLDESMTWTSKDAPVYSSLPRL